MTQPKWAYALLFVCALTAAHVAWLTSALPAAQAGKVYEIKITPNADPTQPPTVSPADQHVGRNDEVTWTCTTGCDFDVVFTESTRKPFKDRAFNKTKKGSGRPTGADGTYKYSVIVGEASNDPKIIIP